MPLKSYIIVSASDAESDQTQQQESELRLMTPQAKVVWDVAVVDSST